LRYTTEELRSIAAQYTTNSEAAEFRLPPGSREVTPSSDREAPSDVAVQSARVDGEGDKRRCKQHPQRATITTDYDDGNNRKADDSNMGRVTTGTHNDKHQAQTPTDHFKRLLEAAFPNHAYPVRHKLKDSDMMKSFMISGSPT
jgi:hypothetical protein